MDKKYLNINQTSLFLLYFLINFYLGCTEKVVYHKLYAREWITDSGKYLDTVENLNFPIKLYCLKDTGLLYHLVKDERKNWIVSYCDNGYFKKETYYKSLEKEEKVEICKYTYSFDTTRDDHQIVFIFSPDTGLLFESDPDNRNSYFLVSFTELSNNHKHVVSSEIRKDSTLFTPPPKLKG